MGVVLPYNFSPGEPAASAKVDANFQALAAAIEGVSAAAAGTDVYQAGVLASTDWVPGAGAIVAGTGVLSFTTFGGAAWLPGPVSGLVRTFTAPATVGALKPPVLPGPGGYVSVGVELTQSGAAAAVSVVSGPEEVSEAEALKHPAAVSAGKTRVRDVIVKNTAGVYSIVKERDRRPWARGAASFRETSALHAEGFSVDAGLAQRVECSGVPLRVEFSVLQLVGAGTLKEIVITVGATELFETLPAVETINQPIVRELVPAAGTNLVTLATSISGGTKTLANARLLIREQLMPFANNGTV